jgi:acyl-coenzyme A thioesterase PaaI-like protein
VAQPNLYGIYRRLEKVPLGKTLFSGLYQLAAPYFLTIPATVESVEPGRATARMAHAPWVRNHLGTVHAIALCNLAELTMGAAAEASVPSTHRWVPTGMQVQYKAMARGTMHATATLELPEPLAEKQTVSVQIPVTDKAGAEVFNATIDIYVTAKR